MALAIKVGSRGLFARTPAVDLEIPEGTDYTTQEIINRYLQATAIDPATVEATLFIPDRNSARDAYPAPSGRLSRYSIRNLQGCRPAYICLGKKIARPTPFLSTKGRVITAVVVGLLLFLAVQCPEIFTSCPQATLAIGLTLFAAITCLFWRHCHNNEVVARALAHAPNRTQRVNTLVSRILSTFPRRVSDVVGVGDSTYLATHSAYYHGTRGEKGAAAALRPEGSGFDLTYLGSAPRAGSLVVGSGAYFAYSEALAQRYTYDRGSGRGSTLPEPNSSILTVQLQPQRVALIEDCSRWEAFRTTLVAHFNQFSKDNPCAEEIFDPQSGVKDIYCNESLLNIGIRQLFLSEGFDAAVITAPDDSVREIIATGANPDIDARTVVMFHPEKEKGQVVIRSTTPPPQVTIGTISRPDAFKAAGRFLG